jgi:phage head maturation protease
VLGEARMRKLIVALVGIAVLIAPAYAQSRGKGSKQSENSQQTDDKKQKKAAAEKAYKDALHGIPEQKSSDPWASMR